MKIANRKLEAIALSEEEKALLESASELMGKIYCRINDGEKLGYEYYGEYSYISQYDFFEAWLIVNKIADSYRPLLIVGDVSGDDFIDLDEYMKIEASRKED